MRPEAGQRFAHFHVYSVLGRGGMGVVFSAFNVKAERVVALKLLPADQSGDPSARERFRRESALARRLRSPYAIEVYDAGEHDGELWLEMPLLPGEDLSTMLRRARAIEPAIVLSIAGNIATALDDAHAIGLVHRDVKPGNIRLVEMAAGEPPRAYLGDFGLTRALVSEGPDLTSAHEVVGTANYMSPEQVRRQPVAPAADIYSLACVVYACLAGAPPFTGTEPLPVMYAHVRDVPPPLLGRGVAPGVGKHLEAAVLAGLAKTPGDRPATAGALVDGLRRAAELDAAGRPFPEVSAGRGPGAERARRGPRWWPGRET